MIEALSAILVGALAFASTNGDNLLVLGALRASGGVSARGLSAGYLIGLAGVLGLCLVVAAASRLIPVQLIGYLGLVPIALGIRELASRSGGAAVAPETRAGEGEVAMVATLQLASSGDTVAVFGPLFAESASWPAAFTLAAFAAMGALWLRLILVMGRLDPVRSGLERWAPVAGPVLMIAIGAYVLANTVTDTLPD